MRVFIAVEVPAEVKMRIHEVAGLLEGRGTTLVRDEAVHVTIEFLGELDEMAVAEAKAALSEVSFRPFDIRAKGLSCFTPEYIKVIFAKIAGGAEECMELHRKVAERLVEHKLRLQKEAFVPHITIARVKSDANKYKVLELLQRYSERDFGSFGVSKVLLKQSVLTGEGPVYSTLHELKL